jgi:hypothetical protein
MKINVETTVAAPIEQVWRAYTTPAEIKQWNAASDDWHTTGAGSRRAAEQRYELAALHSITSSASASSLSGTLRPSALAVVRLMTSLNLVAACTGSSAGLAPLRMRSM